MCDIQVLISQWLTVFEYLACLTHIFNISLPSVSVVVQSATYVCGQQQYFRIQPRDVKVHEGGEAMLECEVGNLAGQVQWTKDGFALGNATNPLIQ